MTLMIADDLACQELVELVTDYLEDALDLAVGKRFPEHLAKCPFCRTYVDQISATIGLAGRVDLEPMSPDVRRRLLDAFRVWHTFEEREDQHG